MPSASYGSSRYYPRRSRRKGNSRVSVSNRNNTAETCASGSSSNGIPTTVMNSQPPHNPPYDLRRKSPPYPVLENGFPNLRKRPRRSCSVNTDIFSPPAAHYLQYELPDEVLLTIFSYLLEKDLCRLSQVCKRFQTIANDNGLWKRLYHNIFEYDIPLFNPEPCKFEFIPPNDCEYANPWKESFRQLYRGIHVRPGQGSRYKARGRSLAHFDTVQTALDHADENPSTGVPSIVFLHAGTYRGEFLVIDTDVALIGAAPGNVAEAVVLERQSGSTMMFGDGAKSAYAGHLTLKFTPDVASTVLHHKHYCLEVGENCSPTIDHCIIRSTSVGMTGDSHHTIAFSFHVGCTTISSKVEEVSWRIWNILQLLDLGTLIEDI